jgi:hypothetical protein
VKSSSMIRCSTRLSSAWAAKAEFQPDKAEVTRPKQHMTAELKVTRTAEHSHFITRHLCLNPTVAMSGVFESAGLALAIPGLIDVIVRGGEVVYRKIETFRTKHETLIRYLLAWNLTRLKAI